MKSLTCLGITVVLICCGLPSWAAPSKNAKLTSASQRVHKYKQFYTGYRDHIRSGAVAPRTVRHSLGGWLGGFGNFMGGDVALVSKSAAGKTTRKLVARRAKGDSMNFEAVVSLGRSRHVGGTADTGKDWWGQRMALGLGMGAKQTGGLGNSNPRGRGKSLLVGVSIPLLVPYYEERTSKAKSSRVLSTSKSRLLRRVEKGLTLVSTAEKALAKNDLATAQRQLGKLRRLQNRINRTDLREYRTTPRIEKLGQQLRYGK
jgi:hypothetical protein